MRYEICNRYWRVVAEHIGEGYSGEYDEDDPEDKPLMRYDFYRAGAEEAEDSYCTLIPVDDESAIKGMAALFLDALEDHTVYPKREMERLTWTEPEVARLYAA